MLCRSAPFLYDPKLTQARFTGLSLLDPSVKRLRPKQAMDYWATKRIEQKIREPPVDVVSIEAEPQPADTTTKAAALEGTLGEDSPADDGLLDAFESPRTLQRKPAASSVLCFQERFAKTL